MGIKVYKSKEKTVENESKDKKVLVRDLDNGNRLIRENDTFFAAVGDEKIMISREEAILILQNHDLIYDVIIGAKRKFYFNTAEDRYSPTDY